MTTDLLTSLPWLCGDERDNRPLADLSDFAYHTSSFMSPEKIDQVEVSGFASTKTMFYVKRS